MTRRVHQNIWGNWKGYVANRLVADFGTDEQEAREWAANGVVQRPNIVGAGLHPVSPVPVTEYNATEYHPHCWVTEASDLGLRPGQFPQQLLTTLGNGRPFVLVGRRGEIFCYRQDLGNLLLNVNND